MEGQPRGEKMLSCMNLIHIANAIFNDPKVMSFSDRCALWVKTDQLWLLNICSLGRSSLECELIYVGPTHHHRLVADRQRRPFTAFGSQPFRLHLDSRLWTALLARLARGHAMLLWKNWGSSRYQQRPWKMKQRVIHVGKRLPITLLQSFERSKPRVTWGLHFIAFAVLAPLASSTNTKPNLAACQSAALAQLRLEKQRIPSLLDLQEEVAPLLLDAPIDPEQRCDLVLINNLLKGVKAWNRWNWVLESDFSTHAVRKLIRWDTASDEEGHTSDSLPSVQRDLWVKTLIAIQIQGLPWAIDPLGWTWDFLIALVPGLRLYLLESGTARFQNLTRTGNIDRIWHFWRIFDLQNSWIFLLHLRKLSSRL